MRSWCRTYSRRRPRRLYRARSRGSRPCCRAHGNRRRPRRCARSRGSRPCCRARGNARVSVENSSTSAQEITITAIRMPFRVDDRFVVDTSFAPRITRGRAGYVAVFVRAVVCQTRRTQLADAYKRNSVVATHVISALQGRKLVNFTHRLPSVIPIGRRVWYPYTIRITCDPVPHMFLCSKRGY